MAEIAEEYGVEMAAVIQKDVLTRSKWEDGTAMLGRESDWERYQKKVLIYSSILPFSQEFTPLISEEGHRHGAFDDQMMVEGCWWRVSVSPLVDASGTDVGDLVALLDITAEQHAFQRRLLGVLGLTSSLFFV